MKSVVEFGPASAMLTIDLEPGEAIKAEPGAMVMMQNLSLRSRPGKGGFLGGLRRLAVGERFFLNVFEAENRHGWVSLAPNMPGDIAEHDLPFGQKLYIQPKSLLACTENVEVNIQFQGLKSMFTTEAAFFMQLQSSKTQGKVWYNSYGAIKRIPIVPNEELIVDTGHLVAFTEHVDYQVGLPGGISSTIMGEEGFILRFTGFGYVWVQSRNVGDLIETVAYMLEDTDEFQRLKDENMAQHP